MQNRFHLALVLGMAWAACGTPPPVPGPDYSASLTVDRAGEAWVRRTLREMTLEQKIGQLFSVVAPGEYESHDDPAYLAIREAVQNLQAGSITYLRSSPLEQAALTNDLQSLAVTPLLVAQDMEFGAGMRVDGATILPAPMALGATRDLDLAYRAGIATASEARALGVHLIYAPVSDVNTDPANPVIGVRSFSDNPRLTGEMVAAFVRGAQDEGVLATVKHFPGHGSARTDSHFALPVLSSSAARLDSVDLPPFRAALDAQVAAVMTGHLALPNIDTKPGRPASLSPDIVQSLLRGAMGFNGLVITDALNMAGVTRTGRPGAVALAAIRAGSDILLMSPDPYEARQYLLNAVRGGALPEARINASVARILRAKAAVGLHIRRDTDLSAVREQVGSAKNRTLAQTIARRAVTLLAGKPAPLSGRPSERVLLIQMGTTETSSRTEPLRTDLARLLPEQALDTVTLASAPNPTVRQALLRRARGYDAVVVASHLPTTAIRSGAASAVAWRRLLALLADSPKPTAIAVLGSPYLLDDLAPLPSSLFATFDDSPSSQQALAAALTGHSGTLGRSPVTISAAFPFGSGIDSAARYPRLARAEEAGMDGRALARVDSLMRKAIVERAFPGAAVAIGRGDALVSLSGYGTYAADNPRPVSPRSTFDLASLTKVVATTTAVMQLYESGKIDLGAFVSRYIPEFAQNGKDSVTVFQLLTHTAGLIPFRPFYADEEIETRGDLLNAIYEEPLQTPPGAEMRYSDFGPIVLGEIVEKLSGEPFARYTRRHIFEPLGMWNTGFRGVGKTDPDAVPTELDAYFRDRLLQGEVHDETAWVMGGTAGHAGLFSTAEDLAKFGLMLVSEGLVGDTRFLKPETLRLFTTAVDSTGTHTRALGWDTKNPEGYSSAGQFFGPRSFGHTGFTGTSFWVDPEAHLYVVLLTNRVNPSRNNRGHIAVRPALADLVHETIRQQEASPMLPSLAD